MDSIQINNILSRCPKVNNSFVGVYSCDNLPNYKSLHFPCCFVANTDPSYRSGEHWTAFFCASSKHVEYFDSYGEPAQNPYFIKFISCFQNILFNKVRIQGSDSTVCGQYCILFLIARQYGYPLSLIVQRFHANESSNIRDVGVCSIINVLTGLNIPVVDMELLL